MKMNSIAGGVVALTLATSLVAPSPAQAGRREWETAGKILTGAAIVTVLHHATRTPSYSRTVHQPVHHHSTVVMHQPVHHSTVVVHQPMPQHSTVVVHTPPAHFGMQPSAYGRRHSRGQYHGRTYQPACDTPVIVQLHSGRRLYQPRIHGHHAFLQEWCLHSRSWVTIGTHPSIW